MFGQSKPVPFDPYGRRRKRRRVPPWLAWLLIGGASGVAAVIFVQERYLPPRLSASESIRLRDDYAQADRERVRLRAERADDAKRLQTSMADLDAARQTLATQRAETQRLSDDVAALIAALPPDPRGGAVQVRAGRFAAQAGGLDYSLVLTRERGGAAPLPAVVQMTVAGTTARGVESAVALQPVALALGAQAVAHGRLSLPDGFKPRQTTVAVLDRSGGKTLGMRVLLLK